MTTEQIYRRLAPVLLFATAITVAASADPYSYRRHHQQENPQKDELVPPNWRALPHDAQIGGRRYVSPDGSSSFAAWATPVHEEPVDEHMNALASADGERVTYRRRERDWMAISGFWSVHRVPSTMQR